MSLLDLVPRLSPNLERPEHLAPVAEALERCDEQPGTKAASSVPPQHGKTWLIMHALVRAMLRHPERHHAYVTYQDTRAHRIGGVIKRIAERAGLEPVGPRSNWTVRGGGGLITAGTNGALTGEPVDGLLVVDDPHKNRIEAESPAMRARTQDFYGDAQARMHPTASILVNHTRYHPDDMIGWLLREETGWAYVNLPVLNDGTDPRADRPIGAALWEKHRPRAWYEGRRASGAINDYDWASLYMGQPRPRGALVFRDVHHYDALPPELLAKARVGVGLDFAYTAKTSADWCVAVVTAEAWGRYTSEDGRAADGWCTYVLDVKRMQATVPAFARVLRGLKVAWPGARWLWHTSTTEAGLADYMREQAGFPLVPELARGDPFVRAQRVAGKWCAGRVLVPRRAPWLAEFVAEVCGFTGVGDAHDDQVAALASADAVLDRGRAQGVPRAFPTKFENRGGPPLIVRPNGNGAHGGGFQW